MQRLLEELSNEPIRLDDIHILICTVPQCIASDKIDPYGNDSNMKLNIRVYDFYCYCIKCSFINLSKIYEILVPMELAVSVRASLCAHAQYSANDGGLDQNVDLKPNFVSSHACLDSDSRHLRFVPKYRVLAYLSPYSLSPN